MIRFAILGCGTIGKVHADAIRATVGADLYGFCDYDAVRAKSYADQYGVKAFDSFDALLADGCVDAVAICTPSGLHADQAIAILNAQKHVVVEKPMALCTADAKRICEAADASEKQLSVIFQTRCAKDIRYLKQILDEGRLGNLVMCDLYMKFWRDKDYYTQSPWRGTFAMDGGGALMNQGIHGVDLMNYLLGAPRLLGAKVKTLVHDIETEDTATALVEYPSGALGVIEAATSTPPGFDRRIEIHGTCGYAVVIHSQLTKLYINGQTIIDTPPVLKPGTASDPTKLDAEAHIDQYKNIVKAFCGEEPLISGARDGYEAIRLIENIYTCSKATD